NMAVTLFLLNLFSMVHPGSFENSDTKGRQAETVDDLLTRGARSIERFTKGRPEVEALLLRNFGDALRARGDLDGAEALLRKCAAVERGMGQAGAEGLLITLQALGRALDDRGDGRGAAAAYHEALDVQKASGRLNLTHGWITIQSVATAHWRAGEFAEARVLFDELFDAVRGLEDGPSIIAQAKSNLAGLYVSQGMYAEAEPIVREAIAGMRSSTMRDMRDEVLTAEGNYAWLLLQLGRPAESLELARKVLEGKRGIYDRGHLKLAKGEFGLAQALLATGQPEPALALLESALPVYRTRAKPGTSTAIEVETTMGECLLDLGRATEARPLLEKSLAAVGGPEGLGALDPSDRKALVQGLARALRATGEAERAALLEKTLRPQDR
ncbi:MAG: tetratricopeptide repeat protein, partial [Phycisphaerales bacterium]